MADHAKQAHGATPMDYPAHERTYEGFIKFTKWGTIVVVGVLVLMAIFLV